MRSYHIIPLITIALFLFSCQDQPQNKKTSQAEEDTSKITEDTSQKQIAQDANPVIIDSMGNEVTLLVNDSIDTPALVPHRIDRQDFSITFPSEPNNDHDSTEQTTIYIYNNEADTERYLLLIKDFDDFEGKSEQGFLEEAAQGILKDFEANEIGLKENIKVGKYNGIRLLVGSPEKSFFSWRIFLKGKTLYQVIIVKNMMFPTKEEIAQFSDTFVLK